MTFNFRGTGTSTGDFSLQGWVDDLRTAIDYIVVETSPSDVVLIGTNTGGSIAICVAADDHGSAPRHCSAPVPTSTTGPTTTSVPRARPRHRGDHDAWFPASFDEWSRAFRRFRPIEAARRFAPDRAGDARRGRRERSDHRRPAVCRPWLGGAQLLVGAGHRLRHDPRPSPCCSAGSTGSVRSTRA